MVTQSMSCKCGYSPSTDDHHEDRKNLLWVHQQGCDVLWNLLEGKVKDFQFYADYIESLDGPYSSYQHSMQIISRVWTVLIVRINITMNLS
jgi:hypothetical protein